MIVITDFKTSYFDFDWFKDVNENLKHKIEFILKSKKYLAKNKIKTKVEQLLYRYKRGNNIHEHGKQ